MCLFSTTRLEKQGLNKASITLYHIFNQTELNFNSGQIRNDTLHTDKPEILCDLQPRTCLSTNSFHTQLESVE